MVSPVHLVNPIPVPLDDGSSQERSLVLDIARALFFAVGVAYHSMLPYVEGSSWLIKSPEPLAGTAPVTAWLHTFRMPGFFLIAGLLSWQMLQRKGPREFVVSRAQRLMVPMAIVLCSFNVVEGAIANHAWGIGGFAPLMRFSHLWFLEDLLVFTLLLPAVEWVVKLFEGRFRDCRWTAERCLTAATVLIVLGTTAALVCFRTAPDMWARAYLGALNPSDLALYGCFFFAGTFSPRRAPQR